MVCVSSQKTETMKRLLFLACSLFALSATAQSYSNGPKLRLSRNYDMTKGTISGTWDSVYNEKKLKNATLLIDPVKKKLIFTIDKKTQTYFYSSINKDITVDNIEYSDLYDIYKSEPQVDYDNEPRTIIIWKDATKKKVTKISVMGGKALGPSEFDVQK